MTISRKDHEDNLNTAEHDEDDNIDDAKRIIMM